MDDRPEDFAIGGDKRPGDTVIITVEPEDTIVIPEDANVIEEGEEDDHPETYLLFYNILKRVSNRLPE
ncbi:hypothetical protein FACS1894186_5350 [Alphaproteobacteria bacterium]|nr:hypothetical protein FACS1894186_5350 [Alphaproteobacteria bacterium]